MADEVHVGDLQAEEDRRGGDGAFGEARDAAQAVSAGAAGSQAGAEAYEEARHDGDWQGRPNRYGGVARREHVECSAEQEAPVFEEVKRRTRVVVRVFPNEVSASTLATKIALRCSEQWALKRYLAMGALEAVE